MRSTRNPIFLGIVQLALAATVYACSSEDSGSGASGGSVGGKGPAGKGGVGGSIGSAGDGSGGTTTSKGGSTSNGGTGNVQVDACPGLPFEDTGSGGDPGVPNGAGGMNGGAPSAGGAGGATDEPPASAGAPSGEGGAPGACVGVSVEAERIDVDMFIMMDRSISMGYELDNGQTRWQALTAAVQDFAQSNDAQDIGAGIGFFSKTGRGDDDADCDASAYADPVVGIGPLADTSSQILDEMDMVTPAGLTPTGPALEGALDYAKGWADDHPDRATVVVLVSDGFPTQCGDGPEDIAAAAEAGYETDPPVKTYVIGVGDVARFNLDNYARSGGTDSAFLTDEANASESFVEALINITGNEISCEYFIPEPPDDMTQIDTDKVQVVYTPMSTGQPEEVPRVNTFGDCADAENGGWYYDNSSAPTRIYVCPCTCARFGAGRVDVRLGCEPRLGIR